MSILSQKVGVWANCAQRDSSFASVGELELLMFKYFQMENEEIKVENIDSSDNSAKLPVIASALLNELSTFKYK